jgi:uncharacterized 2Fe-2S/4Fe-4S cluster protein (DUF4445 family)
LQTELIAALNRLLAQVTAASGAGATEVYEAVFSGNTTMLHLAVGENPAPLGKYPYTPTLRGNEYVAAEKIGLHLAPQAEVYLPPFMSAYVGADIAAGILATALAAQTGSTLFVDIGTNGEMVLAQNGTLIATSTAAGPAFEGMNIACGMRAASGAVERVELDAASGAVTIKTIAAAAPCGICGSGLLDAIGELARCGAIDKNGKFVVAAPWENSFADREGKKIFILAPDVYLTQKDVRQTQHAKGAVRTGIDLMLQANGLDPAQVDRVLIAGACGFHLRTESLVNLGLLPREFAHRVEFVGNTALSGAVAWLVNAACREKIAQQVTAVRVLELANDPTFEKTFIRALGF